MIEHYYNDSDYPDIPGHTYDSTTSSRAAYGIREKVTKFEKRIVKVLRGRRYPMGCDDILKAIAGDREGFELEAFILRHRTRVYQACSKDLIEEADDLGVSYLGRDQNRYRLWNGRRLSKRAMELLG